MDPELKCRFKIFRSIYSSFPQSMFIIASMPRNVSQDKKILCLNESRKHLTLYRRRDSRPFSPSISQMFDLRELVFVINAYSPFFLQFYWGIIHKWEFHVYIHIYIHTVQQELMCVYIVEQQNCNKTDSYFTSVCVRERILKSIFMENYK